MSEDDRKLMAEFEAFLDEVDKKQDEENLQRQLEVEAEQEEYPGDEECTCEMCTMGWDIIPASKA